MKYLDQTGLGYLWTKIKAKLAEKQNTLTFDSSPTAGSDNPVKSGGIKAALDGKLNINGSLYFAPGETYSTSRDMMVCGHVTSGTTALQLCMWLPKSLEKINSISVTNLVGAVRGVNGYVNNWTADTNILTQSGITVDANRTFPNGIKLHIESASAYTNTTNNTPVVFSGKITLSFS